MEYLKKLRWKDGIDCPHCGYSGKIYIFKDNKTFKCAKCRKKFTTRLGTIFEDSPIPLSKWLLAIYLVSGNRKRISSVQLSRDITVTQKTAWFMLKRIRLFSNMVEEDKTIEMSDEERFNFVLLNVSSCWKYKDLKGA